MLTIKEIETKLKDRNLYEVSRRTGIPASTLWRIANGVGYNVAYRTVEKISDYLEGKE